MESREGPALLGRVKAFCGVTQEQVRATLHFHCQAWIHGWERIVEQLIEKGSSGMQKEFDALATKVRKLTWVRASGAVCISVYSSVSERSVVFHLY